MTPRSYILVPAFDAAASRAALAGPADLVVLDLEDMVSPDQKPRARIMLRSGFSADWAGDPRCAVRLNAWGSPAGAVDRMALAGLYMPAVMLPKVNTAADVAQAAEGFRDAELGASAVHAIVETAGGLASASNIARAGAASLVLGAFDLAKVLGVPPDPTSEVILDVRNKVASAARDVGISSFDMPWIAVQDQAGFITHITQAKELGFSGCCAMNNDQAERINALWALPT